MHYKDLAIADLLIKIGDSAIAGKGSISSDDRYGFSITQGRVFLRDIMVKGAPREASVTFKASGRGSFDDPALEVDGVVKGGKVKDVEIGGGTIKALIRDKVLTLEARLLDDRVTLNGEARITEELPWTARMDVRSARLDFILASLLKEVPEDLLINVKGHADMSGDRRHFFSRAVINQLTMTLYGNSFSNDSEFHVEIKDKKVSYPDIRMRSGTTSLRVAGVVDPDPRNPRTVAALAGPRSEVRMPQWVAQPEIDEAAEVPSGTVVGEAVASKALGSPRRVWFYTPPGYETSQDWYPVLYVPDGSN